MLGSDYGMIKITFTIIKITLFKNHDVWLRDQIAFDESKITLNLFLKKLSDFI